jgi:hypothetical protein
MEELFREGRVSTKRQSPKGANPALTRPHTDPQISGDQSPVISKEPVHDTKSKLTQERLEGTFVESWGEQRCTSALAVEAEDKIVILQSVGGRVYRALER